VAGAEGLAQALLGSLDLTCLQDISIARGKESFSHIAPNRALKAGSTFPPLARRTALMTAASIEGKASLSVFCACCSGFKGRGGFGGATSSSEPGCGTEVVVLEDALWEDGDDGFSRGSSSKSNSRAVVGDSGGPVGF